MVEEYYDFQEITKHVDSVWAKNAINAVDLDSANKPFYNLMMFPYPSAEGLHVGNCFAFIGSDIFGRYKKMNGYDVFEPMGFDAFGIHSENYALKVNKHPKSLTENNIANFKKQLNSLGLMIDWRYSLNTTKPEYYHWTQWIFLQLYKNGLAEQRLSPVNWCSSCKTVLADSQVIAGTCERCDTKVEQRTLKQWFFNITKYAERLLNNLDHLNWSDSITTAQRRKIGRSEGAYILFDVPSIHQQVEVFTTRPDTLFGATYLVLAPEHPLVPSLTTMKQKNKVNDYINQASEKSKFERSELITEKTGVFTGSYAINPINRQNIPIWISDYILMDYGTGAIMAVPGHDERDYEFAHKMNLPIIQVISSDKNDQLQQAYTGEGKMINSDNFNGMDSAKFRKKILVWLTDSKKGREGIIYRLRDWCVSRQRYWGPPIPIIHCNKCGHVPVPEKDLPVILPESDNYIPDGSGLSPLARNDKFRKTKCPSCGGDAERETDVSDNFLDSAWYHLRYLSTDQTDEAFCKERLQNWLPIHSYIGGKEHAEGHLLYFRFITMVLHDLGYVPCEEPVTKFRAHGIITKDGAKMSKSKGNVVNPDEYISKYGADVFRLYLMFIGPFTQGGDYSDSGINGCKRFVEGVYNFIIQGSNNKYPRNTERLINITIDKVTNDIENLSYNTAIAQLMTCFNKMKKEDARDINLLSNFIRILAPFTPYLCEKLWQSLNLNKDNLSVHHANWPLAIKSKMKASDMLIVIQINGKVRDKISLPIDTDETQIKKSALESSKIRSYIKNAQIKKIIYVPNKLINIVI